MPQDKIIKSGQFTIWRLLFLAAAGGLIVAFVYFGGVFLSIGYWIITLAICGLLFLIAIDYKVNLGPVDLQSQAVAGTASKAVASIPESSEKASAEAKVKRKTSRAPKRRR